MASYSISTGVKNCKTDKVLFVEMILENINLMIMIVYYFKITIQ